MKITLIREERESGKEAVSTQETDMLMEKLKTENKTGYITELRSIIPHLKGTNARYEHIDRLPRLYPAVEMTRTKAGEHRIKTYNGLVLLEVNNLAGVAEAELVKQQAALLPQTFAAFCGLGVFFFLAAFLERITSRISAAIDFSLSSLGGSSFRCFFLCFRFADCFFGCFFRF